jgi:hypothetical protein
MLSDLIPEDDVGTLTGVSVTTIKRFAEAGYLKVEKDREGRRLFSKKQLSELFGVKPQGAASAAPRDTARTQPAPSPLRAQLQVSSGKTHEAENPIRNLQKGPAFDDADEVEVASPVCFGKFDSDKPVFDSAKPVEAVPVNRQSALPGEPDVDSFSDCPDEIVVAKPKAPSGPQLQTAPTMVVPSYEPPPVQPMQPQPAAPKKQNLEADLTAALREPPKHTEPALKPQAAAAAPQTDQPGSVLTKLQKELERLRSLLDLQDRLLDDREKEVLDLRTQREWLKDRVEKLEQQADRDQLLLLSETHMMRQLISGQTKKRTPVRAALEWFGLAKPAPQTPGANSTVDPELLDAAKRGIEPKS